MLLVQKLLAKSLCLLLSRLQRETTRFPARPTVTRVFPSSSWEGVFATSSKCAATPATPTDLPQHELMAKNFLETSELPFEEVRVQNVVRDRQKNIAIQLASRTSCEIQSAFRFPFFEVRSRISSAGKSILQGFCRSARVCSEGHTATADHGGTTPRDRLPSNSTGPF